MGLFTPGSSVDELAMCERLKIYLMLLRGCFDNEVSGQDFDDIFPIIALLEGRCALEVASNAGNADFQALQVLHYRQQAQAKAGHGKEYYAINFTIYEAIILLANNRWLSRSIADLRKILKLSRLQSLRVPGRLTQSQSEHMTVFAVLKSRDSGRAEASLRFHLSRQRSALRTLQGQQSRLTP